MPAWVINQDGTNASRAFTFNEVESLNGPFTITIVEGSEDNSRCIADKSDIGTADIGADRPVIAAFGEGELYGAT